MAQGTRVRWIRAAIAGLGVMVSTAVVGCTSWDKPKETAKNTGQPKAALPNTPSIPPGSGAAQLNRQPGAAPYTGPGGNIQPAGGFAVGAGRTGPTNPNTTGGTYPYGNTPAGGIGSINPSVQPNVQPAGGFGGPVGAAPLSPAGGSIANYGQAPQPELSILPPAPPAAGNEFAGGVVPPPNLSPVAPIAPTTPPGAGPMSPIKNF